MSTTATRARPFVATRSEKEFQAAVIDTAKRFGWEVSHTFDSRRSAPGVPDLLMVRPPRQVWAELKTPRGTLKPSQEKWLRLLGTCDGTEVHLWIDTPSTWEEIVRVLAP